MVSITTHNTSIVCTCDVCICSQATAMQNKTMGKNLDACVSVGVCLVVCLVGC